MQQHSPQQHPRPISTATLHHPGQISNVQQLVQHIAHPQHGGHLPVWLKKHVASQVMAQHGPSGDAIAHPGIPVPPPQPQQPPGYATGGVIPNQANNNFGNVQSGNQPPPEQIPTDTHNTVQLDPTQFPGSPSPSGATGHRTPVFLGPPVRPGWPGVPQNGSRWPTIGGNLPASPTTLNSAKIGNKPTGMAKGGVVKKKNKLVRK